MVSTHSRPKAAAYFLVKNATLEKFQHTAARRRLRLAIDEHFGKLKMFQHTAARRRLHRAKQKPRLDDCFNTQPPEGGCNANNSGLQYSSKFQHTAARRRLRATNETSTLSAKFQHTAARRRLHELSSHWQRFIIVSTHSRPKAAAVVCIN